jgi:RpiR family carbohydrate utilization transcriptional regulator
MSQTAGRPPVPEEPASYTLDRIRSMTSSLSASELRVALTILEHPHEVLEWSASEIAEHSGTSDATAVRTCRRLGFSGLRDLRLTLARDLGWSSTVDANPRRRKQPFIEELFADAGTSISSMLSGESVKGFAKVAELLAHAERILVVANGPSTIFAQDFVYAARIAGRPAEFWSDTIMQTVIAAQLTRRDVCVAVSASGVNSLTIDVSETASAAGAKVVAVTGYGLSRLLEIATESVVVETFDYSSVNQAAINSAGLLLLLRGLVIAVADKTGTPATTTNESMRRFTYRRSGK